MVDIASAQMPYSGTVFTLTCTIRVDENVNTAVDVDGVWSKGAVQLANNSCISISETTSTGDRTYTTTLTFSPLRNNSVDAGNYTCNAIVTSLLPYITSNSNSDTHQLDVIGK